jgi:hypothetical protein
MTESAVAADFSSDGHSEITFRTDELTDSGVQVKGNRGQFPRFTAKYCKLPRSTGCAAPAAPPW